LFLVYISKILINKEDALMARLIWDKTGERLYEAGVSNGVLYLQKTDGSYDIGVAWNGLTAVNENPTGAEANSMYADNKKYAVIRSAEELGGTIEAYTYPDEFSQCDGSAEIIPGAYIKQQKRTPFGLVYKTLIGNDTEELDHGYKIHLIYGATASPSEKAYETINDSPDGIIFSWEYETIPTEVPGYKPTSSIELDSTKINRDKLKAIEDILFGTENTDPRLPSPAEIIEILNRYKLTFVAVGGGESLTGATIIVYSDSEKTQVVSDLNNLPPGTYYYTVSKDNFETVEGSVTIVNCDVVVEIDLQEDI